MGSNDKLQSQIYGLHYHLNDTRTSSLTLSIPQISVNIGTWCILATVALRGLNYLSVHHTSLQPIISTWFLTKLWSTLFLTLHNKHKCRSPSSHKTTKQSRAVNTLTSTHIMTSYIHAMTSCIHAITWYNHAITWNNHAITINSMKYVDNTLILTTCCVSKTRNATVSDVMASLLLCHNHA